MHSKMRLPRRASGKVENGGDDGDVEVDGVGVGDDEGTADVVDVDDVAGIGGAVADFMAEVLSSSQGWTQGGARLRSMAIEHVGSMAMVQRDGTPAVFNLARQRLPTSVFHPI